MKETVALRKRFCKDFNIPINVFESPYFEERLATIDRMPLYRCLHLYEMFMEEVRRFANEEEYFAEYNRIKEIVINHIKEKPGFNEFITDEPWKGGETFPKKDLYSDDNDGKFFISIDMKKANFSAMRFFDDKIFDGCETWEDFMGQFTDMEHIIRSKYIRQVILGACNPKKQVQHEKELMDIIAHKIKNYLQMAHIISVNTDEILIECHSSQVGQSVFEIKAFLESVDKDLASLVKFDKFKLKKLPGVGWVKQYVLPGTQFEVGDVYVDFKCVECDIFHILVKRWLNIEVSDNDLVFYYNGRLAKYLTAPEITTG